MIKFVLRSKPTPSLIKTSPVLLCKEIIEICSEVHTKCTHALYGRNVEYRNIAL
jgi:hypothetical protein